VVIPCSESSCLCYFQTFLIDSYQLSKNHVDRVEVFYLDHRVCTNIFWGFPSSLRGSTALVTNWSRACMLCYSATLLWILTIAVSRMEPWMGFTSNSKIQGHQALLVSRVKPLGTIQRDFNRFWSFKSRSIHLS
jgi:hypothetical protein